MTASMHSVLIPLALFFAASVQALVIPDAEQISLLENVGPKIDLNRFIPPKKNDSYPERIAIIGSGITGAVTAFRLAESFRRRAPQDRQPSITVFERNQVVGGRITQAYAFNDTHFPVDTCAATFSNQDTCVAQAIQNVGLRSGLLQTERARGGVGVWNGEKFVGFVEEDGFRKPQLWSLYRQLKWFKRYGNNPFDLNNQAVDIRLSFSQLLFPQLDPQFAVNGEGNLSRSVQTAGLDRYVQNFLCAGDVGDAVFPIGAKGALFLDEVSTAAERERYFGNVFDLNVLEYLFGYEDRPDTFVEGGNLGLITRLLKIATTDVRLGTEVKSIQRQLTGDVKLISESVMNNGSESEAVFDAVVIATSIERSNVTFDPPLEGVLGLGQKYKDTFITHFTTTELLNGSYFNRRGQMPQFVLTTQSVDDAFDGVEPLFFSITLLRQLLPDGGRVTEYLFKIVSREEIPDSEIEKMLLEPVLVDTPKITWIDRRPLPQSIPITEADGDKCKILLEKIEIAPNIYYAGAGEQVIGGAEFGYRMGLNAANLILDGELQPAF